MEMKTDMREGVEKGKDIVVMTVKRRRMMMLKVMERGKERREKRREKRKERAREMMRIKLAAAAMRMMIKEKEKVKEGLKVRGRGMRRIQTVTMEITDRHPQVQLKDIEREVAR